MPIPEALPVEAPVQQDTPPVEQAPVQVAPPQPVEAVQPVAPVPSPAIPEPAPAPVPEPAPEPAPVIPPATAIDAAESLLQAQGFDVAQVTNQLIQNGKLDDATQEQIVSKFGQAQALIMLDTFKSARTAAEAQAKVAIQSVHDTVGGEDTWNKIAEWTATPEAGLSDDAADMYNEMLASGGVRAELAAKALKEAYMAAVPGFNNTPLAEPTGVVPPTSAIQAISRPQYIKDRQTAVRDGDQVLVESLDARATHTMEHAPNQWRVTKQIN